MNKNSKSENKLRFIDFLIIIVFLSIALWGVYKFRADLLQTISLQNVQPVGTVVVKKNTVQRRISDRVLWDRLTLESPVYLGDLISVADASAASLNIEKSSFDLDENTMIRIARSDDGEGLKIMLNGGNLSVAAGGDVTVDIGGHQVHATTGTVLKAVSNDQGGVSVQVSEGSVRFVNDDGNSREISSGDAVSVDENGFERNEKTAVVTRPSANAYYLKNTHEPLAVDFAWSRVNFSPDETIKLEIAADRNFTREFKAIENLNNRTQADFNTGSWYWRLLFDDKTLYEGRFTVVDALGPRLISPAMNSQFNNQNDLTVINYQWSEIEDAQSYSLQICNQRDFVNPQVSKTVSSAHYSGDERLGDGTWYWRVRPVFPDMYQGSSSFSEAAIFQIGYKTDESPLPDIRQTEPIPEPVAEPVRTPVAEPAPVPVRPQASPTTPLPAPQNMRPERGRNIGVEDLQYQRNIVFAWSQVDGANAYIFTLYYQEDGGRRQIVSITLDNRSVFPLDEADALENGTYLWQVEAIYRQNGTIERRGRIAESVFVFDLPALGPVEIEDAGILYGN